ncbi:hypothetical protein VTK73DRAFT_4858 [Phialemonium thermophilum]|uniref:Uncharacterized protein n=1 Tax=Phialemonium thermophilum TaxID=223376 RepID=A0ABR3WRS0_9PEZI
MARQAGENPDEVDITIRFKHGIHTIFLFVDPLSPFSQITADLLEVLRERYPDGLTASVAPPKTTPVPSEKDKKVRVAYAVMRNPNDPMQGLRPLDVSDGDTPVDKGIKDNSVLAFALLGPDADEDKDVQFDVVWSQLEEEAEPQR